MKKKNSTGAMIGIAVAVIALVFGGVALTRNIGKSDKVITKEAAMETLEKYYKRIDPTETAPIKGQVTFSEEDSLFQELPDLKADSITVQETTPYYAEIFASSEKTGTGKIQPSGHYRKRRKGFRASAHRIERTAGGLPRIGQVCPRRYLALVRPER